MYAHVMMSANFVILIAYVNLHSLSVLNYMPIILLSLSTVIQISTKIEWFVVERHPTPEINFIRIHRQLLLELSASSYNSPFPAMAEIPLKFLDMHNDPYRTIGTKNLIGCCSIHIPPIQKNLKICRQLFDK